VAWLERHGSRLVLAMVAIHAGIFTGLAAYKLRHYLYTDFDLAIFAHAVSQALRGSLDESIGGMRWLGGHVAPVLFLLAPLWAVFRSPLLLLAAQNLALAGAAWPLYRLARRELGAGVPALAFAFAWLLQPALGYTALFEFHPETLAVPALLFAVDALRAGRTRALVAWTAFALLTREDVALVVLGLAAFALLQRPRRPAAAAAVAGLAMLSLVLSFAVIIPRLGSGYTEYGTMFGRWAASMHGVPGAVVREPLRALAELFGTPGDATDTTVKRLWYVYVLLPFACLPLASPLALVPLPIVFEHFLSSRMSAHSIVFHYSALVLPFLAAAAVLGAGSVARRLQGRTGALAACVAGCALASQVLYGPFGNVGMLRGIGPPEALRPEPDARALEPWRDRMFARVPRQGDVVAGLEYLDRLTDRSGLHALHHFIGGHYTFSTRPYAVPRGVTAMIGDLGTGSLFKHVNDGTSGRWRELMAANERRLRDSADDLVLFTRGDRDSVRLWNVAEPRAPRVPPVVYDGQVAFVGSEVDSAGVPAGGRATWRTYWRRVTPTNRFFLTEILVLGPDGRATRELWRYLGYTMHPVPEWPQGSSVCETYRLVVPAGSPPGRYTVGERLWWRRDGQGICAVDDASVRRENGYVEVGTFTVGPSE